MIGVISVIDVIAVIRFCKDPPSFFSFDILAALLILLRAYMVDVISVIGVIDVIGVITFCKGPSFLLFKKIQKKKITYRTM